MLWNDIDSCSFAESIVETDLVLGIDAKKLVILSDETTSGVEH
jgi:hypothetical protein